MIIDTQRPTHRFTPHEAESFLAGWIRVAENDGSTVAYTPDRVTAEAIIRGLDTDGPLAALADAAEECARRLGMAHRDDDPLDYQLVVDVAGALRAAARQARG